jgi:predicted enzyme related to lactoylglutathione lyase
MEPIHTHFLGVELYSDNLDRAKNFYLETLGLEIADEQADRYCKLKGGSSFICLETKGTESYSSKDKAVLFFEVPDLKSAIEAVGRERIVRSERTWAVLHDPEGHNVLLLQRLAKREE